jgi:hypothetical protein
LDEEGEVGGDDGRAADVSECGSGADGDFGGGVCDEAELAEVVDGEEGFLREAAGGEGDHELGAAGDGGEGGVGGEEGEGLGEGGWGEEGVLGGVGAHKGSCELLVGSCELRGKGKGKGKSNGKGKGKGKIRGSFDCGAEAPSLRMTPL